MITPSEILGPRGRIAARLANYEHRPEQLELADAVAESLVNGGHLLAEAGTGVGKSFGYLVPAILAVAGEPADDEARGDKDDKDDEDDDSADDDASGRKRQRRVVISTHTISLQEQLLGKDIPFLRSVMPHEFTALLVKGRRNYLSRRRLDVALTRQHNLFGDPTEWDQLRQIRDWARESHDGSLSDLTFRPWGSVWDEVASDSGNCLGRQCATHKRCFYFAARRRVHHAQILVVNHALFFSDLALRMQKAQILPDYDAVIFDEAHTLEATAADHLGLGVGSGQIDYLLNRLYNDRQNKGLLAHLQLKRAQQLVQDCQVLAGEFFDDVQTWFQQRKATDTVLRVREPNIVDNRLSPALRGLARQLSDDRENVPNAADLQDLLSAESRLGLLAAELESWNFQEAAEAVYWIERSSTRRGQPRVKLAAAPIDVGGVLREHLFAKVRSVILTSATLAVGKERSFQFFQSRVGLTQARGVQVGSPFNYRQQAKLILLRGMPDPSKEPADFERLCAAMVQRYVARTDGRAFVLFTSYDLLRRVVQRLAPWLAERNLATYSQAEGLPRGMLLDQFKQNPRGVLFGTDSFWQGVDVPGDALQNVIITKLPFSVPDHPLLQARLEAIRERGGNPFRDYQLPEAVIKLRQGFGRLIRTRADRGIVVILDPRVRGKPYGRVFLDSLPDCQVVDEHVTGED